MLNLSNLNQLRDGESVSYNNAVTLDTVKAIIQLVRDSVHVPIIRSTVKDILYQVEEKNWKAEIESIFDYVKNNVRYTRDMVDVEFLQTPERLLKDIHNSGKAFGDCDDHVVLLASLLHNAGYNTRIVIIQSRWNTSGGFNHVYLHVNIPYSNLWVSLDATAKNENFGWETEFILRKIFPI